MKKLFVLASFMVTLWACKESPKTTSAVTQSPVTVATPPERVEIADAKNKLSAAETQTRLGNLDPTQYEAIIALLDKGIDKNKDAADAYALRAWAKFRLQKTDDALTDYNKALSIDPKTVPALTGRGSLYEAQGKFSQALVDYDNAIAIFPNDATNYNNRGALKRKMAMLKEALVDFTQAITLNGNEPLFYLNRGNVQVEMKKYDDAKADYEKSMTINAQYGPAYAGRANVYYQLGDFKKAIEDYDQALKWQPENADAWRNRGYNKYKLGQTEPALVDINKALSLKKGDKLALQFKDEVSTKSKMIVN